MGAKFEIYNRHLKVVDTIITDSRGVATSKDLPVGIYGVKEVEAPEYYHTDGKVFYAEIKTSDDLVRFEVLKQSENFQVAVEKRDNVETMVGDQMRYMISPTSRTLPISTWRHSIGKTSSPPRCGWKKRLVLGEHARTFRRYGKDSDRPIEPHTYEDFFSRVAKQAGIEGATFHTLRHP